VNEVRIISGKWRRRKLAFPNRPTLRPTPDRARETLFNWLAPHVEGARCLDLFAGSGALGFEALSRGAASVTLIDDDPVVVQALRDSAQKLGASGCTIVKSAALLYLRGARDTWDIVFLDPPFTTTLLAQSLAELSAGSLLHQDSIVYLESSIHAPPDLTDWQTIKRSRTGAVQSMLVARRV
jgi:16S rRNA (guanine966-N2)-methyltransferase